MYCVYCGVKLQDGAKECPLCHTPVMLPQKAETIEKSPYSDRMPEEEKQRLAEFLEKAEKSAEGQGESE